MVVRTRGAIRQQQQQQQQQQQRQRQEPPRPAHQRFHIISNNNPLYDGIITHFNISRDSITKLSRKVPFMTGEKHRRPRHIFTNETSKYVPQWLFRKIVREIITHLKYNCNIDADFVSSDWGQWVLAPNTNLCNSRHGGKIHRDTTRVEVGYLTALILLGNRGEEEYGGVTI